MTGRDSEAWADGPATDQELGMGGDTAPAARRTDADLPDPLVGDEDVTAADQDDAEDGLIDDETGHGDGGPLGKEV
ncbi:hypothetical protein [Propioniciclava soli]|uniref:Sugar ABC transporter ATPase n=1 Tax=Propioniciclava soli TaxID=2775081 RepID=A0ABZ3CB14_9ACTN|nr:hypothetical protein [Propioniciclava soli]